MHIPVHFHSFKNLNILIWMTLGEILKEVSLLIDCGIPQKVDSGTYNTSRGWGCSSDAETTCVHMSFFFNSPTKCNSFCNIPHRAFKTKFPPALHAVTGLYVFLDNAVSAFLLCNPEKKTALLNAKIRINIYIYIL